MGLFDVDTMNEIRAALDKLPRGQEILMYGEPWQGGQSMLRRYEANKANLQMLSTRIGVFSDDTRDAIKGNCFEARSPGYVEGRQDAFWDIGSAVGAWCLQDRVNPRAPSQIISYVSAHDNLTLWDKLMARQIQKAGLRRRPRRHPGPEPAGRRHLSDLHGHPLYAGGRGVCPHKKGLHNSYRSPASSTS